MLPIKLQNIHFDNQKSTRDFHPWTGFPATYKTRLAISFVFQIVKKYIFPSKNTEKNTYSSRAFWGGPDRRVYPPFSGFRSYKQLTQETLPRDNRNGLGLGLGLGLTGLGLGRNLGLGLALQLPLDLGLVLYVGRPV